MRKILACTAILALTGCATAAVVPDRDRAEANRLEREAELCSYDKSVQFARSTNEAPLDIGFAAYSACIDKWMAYIPLGYRTRGAAGIMAQYQFEAITRNGIVKALASNVVIVRAGQ